MPIEFDKRKDKNLIMMVEKSGVDNDDLKLTFNININNIKYGFPCKLKENKVIINIPALDNIVNNLDVGEYKATLDITGSDKYFMQPFNENIEIIDVPEVIVDKESLKETKLFVKVSELIDDGKIQIDEKEIEKPDKKDNKEIKFNIQDIDLSLTEGNTLSNKKEIDNKEKPISDPPSPKVDEKEKKITIINKMFE